MLRRSSSGIDIGSAAGLGLPRRSISHNAGLSILDAGLVLRCGREPPGSRPDFLAFWSRPGAVADKPPKDGRRRSLALICMLAAIDGMDIQLLPASFKALEEDLGLKPTHLALLAVCQGWAMCVSGPFWGNVADQGFPRKWLLAAGSMMWGMLTLLLALCSSFHGMLVLRTLNGVALGLLTPVIQSFIAEMSDRSEMGFSFGCIDFCHMAVGQTLALVIISSVAGQEIWGIEGWKLAFAAVALLSMGMAVPIVLCLEERPRPWRPEGVSIIAEFQKFWGYMHTPTFLVLVAQGVFGTVPGSAMAFTPMYLQYVGIGGSLAGAVSAFKIVGGGIGSLLGGLIGDRLALHSPLYGRALAAQFSVLLSIPISMTIFLIVPVDPSQWPVYAALLLLLGLVHWCSSGCNRPVLVELVSPDSIGSVVAWQNCVEHMSGFVLGPVGVAVLSEACFDYHPARRDAAFLPAWERQANAEALGQGLAVCTALPWSVCFLLYAFLHITYPRDVARKSVAPAGDACGGPSEWTPLVLPRPQALDA